MLKKLSLVALVLGFGVITAVSAVSAPVNADEHQEGVCSDSAYGDTHLSTVGNQTSWTIEATPGFLIDKYCVKAGSINQGDGPEYHEVTPPAASVTIEHSSGKDISHFTFHEIPEESVASASVSKTPATCETGEVLVYGAITNATYDETSTPDGTTGPADYEVVAIADEGAEFTGESTFTGTLDGPLTGTDCVLGETDPDPEVLPNTSGSIATTVLAGLVSVAAFAGLISLAVRSILTRQ
jgi:hypothetical protein